MTKIKEFLKCNIKLVTLILFVLEFFLSVWITPNKYDSAFFIEKMSEMSIFDFISMRYQTWTSRVIIEILICIILPHRGIVWALLNTIMMTLLGCSIFKLFIKDEEKSVYWLALCFILIYPLNKIATCDWGAGSMNYTWPLAMALFSIIPIKKIFEKEKIVKIMFPLYSMALIFACNQEQSCIILLLTYFIYTILYFFNNKKKVHPFLVIQCVLAILSLIFIITCPGNYARKSDEIATYYMEFESFGLLDKVSLGLTSTVNNLLTNTNISFLVFSLISTVYIFNKYKNNLYRGISLIPLVMCLLFGVFKDIFCRVYPYFGIFYESLINENTMLTAENYLNFINFIPLILAFVVLGSMLVNILIIFKKVNNKAVIIYCIGVISRIMLGFSPTVFASTDRTFIFLDFTFLIISILIYQEFMKETDKIPIRNRTRIATFVSALAVLQYFHNLIYVLMSQM